MKPPFRAPYQPDSFMRICVAFMCIMAIAVIATKPHPEEPAQKSKLQRAQDECGNSKVEPTNNPDEFLCTPRRGPRKAYVINVKE